MAVKMAAFEKAMSAALGLGGSAKDNTHVKVDRHDFNVDRARISREGNKIIVKGDDGNNISHRLSLRPDDQVLYSFEKEGNNVSNLQIEIKKGGVIPLIKMVIELLAAIEALKASSAAAGKSDEATNKAAFEETKKLLDGSWEGEARFLVANIASRVNNSHVNAYLILCAAPSDACQGQWPAGGTPRPGSRCAG
jgi:hypothetical protein